MTKSASSSSPGLSNFRGIVDREVNVLQKELFFHDDEKSGEIGSEHC